MADKKIDLSKKYYSALREEKKKLFAMRTEKYCKWCNKYHSLEDFYQPSASGLTGMSAYCRDGTRAYARERYYKRRARRIEMDKLTGRRR